MNTSKALGFGRLPIAPEQAPPSHETRICSSLLSVALMLSAAGTQALVAATVPYLDEGNYAYDIQGIPGVHLFLPFYGSDIVLSEGWHPVDPTVSNVTFHGHIDVQPPLLINYDNGGPLVFHFITGCKAFGGNFSSYSSPWQSSFMGTMTTDWGESFTFPGLTTGHTFFGMVSTDSLHEVTFSDGASVLHEESVYNLRLVVNPAPTLDVFPTRPQLTLAVNGTQGQTITIEVSTNLVTWQALTTTTLTSDRWIYTETQATLATTRYYRTSMR